MTEIAYRSAAPADAAALAALGRDSFVDKFGHLYTPEDLVAFLDEVHEESAYIGISALHPLRGRWR